MHKFIGISIVLAVCLCDVAVGKFYGVDRPKCVNSKNDIKLYEDDDVYKDLRKRLISLRNQMRIRASVQGAEIDAYIVTSYDEHQTERTAPEDRRREFITGFTGDQGEGVVTLRAAALWVDPRFVEQADRELSCDWIIFKMDERPMIPEWLSSQLPPESRIGADPHLVPHGQWKEWDGDMAKNFLKLVKVNKNLIDMIWSFNRPPPSSNSLKVQPVKYAGEKWELKIQTLRNSYSAVRCDAMIVTSLTEIAFLLNLRGNDIPYIPVFKAYMIVTNKDVILYTNKTKTSVGTNLHLKSEPCNTQECVIIKNYIDFWADLRTLYQSWKRVLLPSFSVFDMGASEAIYASLPKEIVVERVSPVIYMRAQKNEVEREGMRRSHIRDAAAMCDTMSYLEERFVAGDHWTESLLAREVDRSRRIQVLNQGVSRPTIVAYGLHSSQPYYQITNNTDVPIRDDNIFLIESGGQYLDGTTDVSRTFHLGKPTSDQKKAYTNILIGLIRFSMLVFPDNLKPSEADALTRSVVWGTMKDYPHGTGHGIGAYLSVHESPINIAYTTKQKYTFKEGYFFSNEPGVYMPGDFGVRLENILEVIDTGERHPSGAKFLAFRDVTLVPFEPKLIDKSIMSVQEKKYLNEYNARIRDQVGSELKRQMKVQAFYWMMNKTTHVTEYLSEDEYNRSSSVLLGAASNTFIYLSAILALKSIAHF